MKAHNRRLMCSSRCAILGWYDFLCPSCHIGTESKCGPCVAWSSPGRPGHSRDLPRNSTRWEFEEIERFIYNTLRGFLGVGSATRCVRSSRWSVLHPPHRQHGAGRHFARIWRAQHGADAVSSVHILGKSLTLKGYLNGEITNDDTALERAKAFITSGLASGIRGPSSHTGSRLNRSKKRRAS